MVYNQKHANCTTSWTINVIRLLDFQPWKLVMIHYEKKSIYRMQAIVTRSWSVTALVYKLRILGLKNEEFSFLVHKWSVI